MRLHPNFEIWFFLINLFSTINLPPPHAEWTRSILTFDGEVEGIYYGFFNHNCFTFKFNITLSTIQVFEKNILLYSLSLLSSIQPSNKQWAKPPHKHVVWVMQGEFSIGICVRSISSNFLWIWMNDSGWMMNFNENNNWMSKYYLP